MVGSARRRRGRDVWTLLKHAVVSGSVWVSIVWATAMLVTATGALVVWGLVWRRWWE